jgi:hypothetical protein
LGQPTWLFNSVGVTGRPIRAITSSKYITRMLGGTRLSSGFFMMQSAGWSESASFHHASGLVLLTTAFALVA